MTNTSRQIAQGDILFRFAKMMKLLYLEILNMIIINVIHNSFEANTKCLSDRGTLKSLSMTMVGKYFIWSAPAENLSKFTSQ